MRDLTPTEMWLCNWLNECAAVVPVVDCTETPVMVSFMIPKLAQAISNRVESAREAEISKHVRLSGQKTSV